MTHEPTTAMYFDLSVDDDLLKLGDRLGRQIAGELTPLVKMMSPEGRAVFFAAFLGGPCGCMGASMGAVATNTVLETLKDLVSRAEAQAKATQH